MATRYLQASFSSAITLVLFLGISPRAHSQSTSFVRASANIPVPAAPLGLGRNRQPQPVRSIPRPTTPAPSQILPPLEPQIPPLSVPDLTVPLGNTGNRSDILAVPLAQMPWMTNVGGPGGSALGRSDLGVVGLGRNGLSNPSPALSYRIFVEIPHPALETQIRQHVQWLQPGAFPTEIQGRRVMQVGHVRDRRNADRLLQRLMAAGFWPRMETLQSFR